MSDDDALCERLARGFEDATEFTVVVDKADLRAAIAAIRRARADAFEEAARVCDGYSKLNSDLLVSAPPELLEIYDAMADECRDIARAVRALATAPAADQT